MLKWIFFDIGSVLFNDDPQNFRFYEFVYDTLNNYNLETSFSDLMRERERRVTNGEQWISRKILVESLGEETTKHEFSKLYQELKQNYDDYHLLQENLHEILDNLRSKYKLGVIANQVKECRDSLIRRNLFEYFEVIALSEELDLHKPDVELYHWALKQSHCSPHETLMIGDRLDNDVAPAKQAGMQTMFLNWDTWTTKNWSPHNDHARLFLESCARTPMFSLHHVTATPHVEVPHFNEILPAIAQWEHSIS
jgi:HAD superfamily hydrolase (TIGR01549 family)